MPFVPLEDYEKQFARSPEIIAQTVEPTHEAQDYESYFAPVPVEQDSADDPQFVPLYRRRSFLIGAGVAVLLGAAAGLSKPMPQQAVAQTPVVASPNPDKSPSVKPSTKASSAPKPVYATIPAGLKDCTTPRVKMIVNADLALKIPINLTNGKEAELQLKNGVTPHARYSGALGVGACLKTGTDTPALEVSKNTVTVPRNIFAVTDLFPAVNQPNGTNTESVDGYAKNGTLKANAAQFLSAAEANRINAMLVAGGSNNTAFRQTADQLLRDSTLTQITAQNGVGISARLDASLLAQLQSANKKYTFVLTGQYDSLTISYDTATAAFTPLPDVQAAGPASVGATIINIEAKK